MRSSIHLLFFLACAIGLSMCTDDKRTDNTGLFTQVDKSHSGIDFVNKLTEDRDFNIIEYLYFYNGGGVAIGDINNDSLPDIYFTGNQVPNKLFLNKGNFVFEDITAKAGVEGKGNWKTGVNFADVNADGFLDIFVCGVGSYKKFDGRNQLYINNGDLTFTDRTEEYGLSFRGFSTQSAFFDFDLDGDLDMYLLNHSVHSQRSYGPVKLREERDSLAGDRLYRNMLVENGKTFFKDVTVESGIYSSQIGYGLGVGIHDLNDDGYPDIYISNDFIENDYLYINKGDGTFSQQLEKSIPHTSRFSMGSDVADINNDGRPDIFTVDMLPNDESVIKTSAGEDSYEVYTFKLKYGYQKQVSRNAFQVNRGVVDSSLFFSDIAPAAGVEATDWSWGPLLEDFDGDGFKDLFVSNGIVRRPNDLDYINFISSDSIQKQTDVLPWIKKMPEGNVSNFIFRNNGDLTFENKTSDWGISLPSFSNGDAVADLDGDGDPDLVVNRINDVPLVYRNNSSPDKFLKVVVKGDKGNPFAIGAKVIVTQDSATQTRQLFPTRGWCSSSDYALTFGLNSGKNSTVTVTWPDGKTLEAQPKGRTLIADYAKAVQGSKKTNDQPGPALLKKIAAPSFKHEEDEFNAFNRESLMPHMLTTEGPGTATGDVNGDGLDDVFIGGAKNQAGALYIQSKSGSFSKRAVSDFDLHKECEDVAAEFFDADGDKDLDLIVVSGGHEELDRKELIRPRIYLNDGKGNFKYSERTSPKIALQGSCVKAADYDNDGDQDLFIGASVVPMLYGMSPVSFLLNNNGSGMFFSDAEWLGKSQFDNPTRTRPGMVKDAVWTDVNNDKLLDLVLVGEWMPVTVLLQQKNHKFLNVSAENGLTKTNGWWNSVAAKDLDGDGDVDLIAGNLGLNSRVRATPEKPLTMYLGDFDSNSGSDHILVYYNGDKSYPFTSRDQLVKQIPSLKKKFLNYYDYRNVKLEDIVTPQLQGNSAVMHVDSFVSGIFINNDGKFSFQEFPVEAQLFPIYSIVLDDIDKDGNDDILLAGNFTASQPDFGPYDAGLGLLLKGNGKGKFVPVLHDKSGFAVKGEVREIKVITMANGEKAYLVARNNDTVLLFKKP